MLLVWTWIPGQSNLSNRKCTALKCWSNVRIPSNLSKEPHPKVFDTLFCPQPAKFSIGKKFQWFFQNLIKNTFCFSATALLISPSLLCEPNELLFICAKGKMHYVRNPNKLYVNVDVFLAISIWNYWAIFRYIFVGGVWKKKANKKNFF